MVLDVLFGRVKSNQPDLSALVREKDLKLLVKSFSSELRSVSKTYKLSGIKTIFFTPECISLTNSGSLILNNCQLSRALLFNVEETDLSSVSYIMDELNSAFSFLSVSITSYLDRGEMLMMTAKGASHWDCEKVLLMLEKKVVSFLISRGSECDSVVTPSKWYSVLVSSV